MRGVGVGPIYPQEKQKTGSFLEPLSLGGQQLLTQDPLRQSLFAQLNGAARDFPTHLTENASPLLGIDGDNVHTFVCPRYIQSPSRKRPLTGRPLPPRGQLYWEPPPPSSIANPLINDTAFKSKHESLPNDTKSDISLRPYPPPLFRTMRYIARRLHFESRRFTIDQGYRIVVTAQS